ncbi:lipopolysaccharide heptosyltransferase RfaC [Otariodibacter sp.]|uniref:lipopolysaccharide heptosyltransferase RfaC n=1 Tax=Otariodibacter sp. TaxID=3030919 RepID=UPI00262CA345|nr:lipopolysaccharide heptosyltransferase RfaC [Otariodibacter sp.]
MKICLIKTSSMGDVIHSLPALTDAQQAIPDLQVDWVVESAFAEIPLWHSSVNKVIPISLRKWRKSPFSAKTREEWRTYKILLQSEQYDAVIDAQGLLKSALFATRLAKGMKHGYDRHSIREPLASLFYDKTYKISYQQHAVERIRQLFSQSLGYDIKYSLGDYGIADRFSQDFAKKGEELTACKPYIVAIHATTRADKHWPENYWMDLFEQLIKRDINIRLPWGNAEEKARAERFAQRHPDHIQVLPKLTLTELAYQISNAESVISVDTGLSHLTAALDKPNIILYGATDPNLIGAYGKNQIYLHDKGMENILPEQVLDQIE